MIHSNPNHIKKQKAAIISLDETQIISIFYNTYYVLQHINIFISVTYAPNEIRANCSYKQLITNRDCFKETLSSRNETNIYNFKYANEELNKN